jgi:hypothetical protein
MIANKAEVIQDFFNKFKDNLVPINSYSFIDSFHVIAVMGLQECYTSYEYKNQIEILPIPLNCGGMICFPDDITFAVVTTREQYPQLGVNILLNIANFLEKNYNIITQLEKNDLMVLHNNQWFKIGSCATIQNKNNTILIGVHLSIDMNK